MQIVPSYEDVTTDYVEPITEPLHPPNRKVSMGVVRDMNGNSRRVNSLENMKETLENTNQNSGHTHVKKKKLSSSASSFSVSSRYSLIGMLHDDVAYVSQKMGTVSSCDILIEWFHTLQQNRGWKLIFLFLTMMLLVWIGNVTMCSIEKGHYDQILKEKRSFDDKMSEIYAIYNISQAHQEDILNWGDMQKYPDKHPWSENPDSFWYIFSIFTSAGINHYPPETWGGEFLITLCFPATILWSVVAFGYNIVWTSVLETHAFIIHDDTILERFINILISNFSILHFIALVFVIFSINEDFDLWNAFYCVANMTFCVGADPKVPLLSTHFLLDAFIFHGFMVCIGGVFSTMQRFSQRIREGVIVTHEKFFRPRLREARMKRITAEIKRLKKRSDSQDPSVMVKIRRKEASLKQSLDFVMREEIQKINERKSRLISQDPSTLGVRATLANMH